ncbi:1,2-phenylacetyl-CoA epoxidase subunit PaaD [Microbacterium sp. 4R-513]|uniref:1,2-phenylacetyl-CoA epoxidase subunit PaaD n=1 Tax=Microbacterium sp. 4R-513 TaxID=2567934 RepID=UPI001F493757|nr:1,2-phenylacetyl-CoA epoxidase subunit PaaD [Microbacterium sp. 4R-513]
MTVSTATPVPELSRVREHPPVPEQSPVPELVEGSSLGLARRVAASVTDPEVPVLTIEDLGILRSVDVDGDRVVVTITPTYSGCPAVDTIRDDLVLALSAAGFAQVDVRLTLAPAWTTDWMSDAGKRKLEEFGIAPPTGRAAVGGPIPVRLSVRCPRCGSLDTRELARFGSTSCKALYECRACLEPFDHFKAH